jgi:3-oxoacyl-(acyl-carrier-protein) synthase
VSVAGEVPDFDAATYLDTKEARRTDPFTHYAIASAVLAWADAGDPEIVSDRGGVIFASGIGGIQTLIQQHMVLLEKGPNRVSPFMVPMLMANAAAGHLAMRFGLMGHNMATLSACASSNNALGEGMRLIRDGYLDLCIVGGSEAATVPLTVAAFAQMTALTKNPDPETASRPFDANRNGFVLSEGGASLILESEEHATARGARMYCEVAGYGASDDAYHITAPDPKGAGRDARDALGVAGRRCAARRRQLHQRARDVDPAERRVGDRGHQGGPGRPRARRGGLIDQVDDGTHAWRRRRGRRRRMRARDRERPDPAHDPLRNAGSGLRPRHHAERSA